MTFIFNPLATSNKAMIYPDAATRADGSAFVVAPSEWVDALTALHIVTTDYTQFVSNMPKRVIKFKTGSDLASKVK